MAYILQVPTLQHMAGANIATQLWKNHPDIQQEIITVLPELYDNETNEEKHWIPVENLVREKVNHLPLPKILLESVRNFIRPLGLELCEWILYFHYHVLCWKNEEFKAVKCIDYTEWTPHGKINVVKTAETLLMTDNHLSMKDKYQIACVYCLEISVSDIWLRLDDESKTFFTSDCWVLNSSKFDSVKFWTKKSDFSSKLDEYNRKTGSSSNEFEYMFRWAINYNNEAAVKYFWYKLTPKQQNNNLFLSINDVADHWHARGVMCFLLTHIKDHKTSDLVFRDTSFFVLECLLSDWLYCDFFIPTLTEVYAFLSTARIMSLLWKAANLVRKFPGSKYSDIFSQFWACTSAEFKRICLQHEGDRIKLSNLVQELSESGDLINIKLLLQDIDIEIIKTILSQCVSLLVKGKWEFFKLMVVELIPNEEEIKSFKALCSKKLYIIYSLNFLDEKQWELMDCVLWLFTSQHEIDAYKQKIITGPHLACKLTQEMELYDENQSRAIDNVFKWLSMTRSEIKSYKKNKLAVHHKVINALLRWVCEDRWETIDAFLNWCFTSEYEISVYKEELLLKDDLTVFIKNSINIDKSIYSTCKILDWCFGNCAPKRLLRVESLFYACDWLLLKNKFDSANQFVARYCPKKEVIEFKWEVFYKFGLSLFNRYLQSVCSRNRQLMYQYRKPELDRNELYSYFENADGLIYSYFDGKEVEKLILWFDLSSEMIAEFRVKIDVKSEVEFKRNLLPVLDRIIGIN